MYWVYIVSISLFITVINSVPPTLGHEEEAGQPPRDPYIFQDVRSELKQRLVIICDFPDSSGEQDILGAQPPKLNHEKTSGEGRPVIICEPWGEGHNKPYLFDQDEGGVPPRPPPIYGQDEGAVPPRPPGIYGADEEAIPPPWRLGDIHGREEDEGAVPPRPPGIYGQYEGAVPPRPPGIYGQDEEAIRPPWYINDIRGDGLPPWMRVATTPSGIDDKDGPRGCIDLREKGAVPPRPPGIYGADEEAIPPPWRLRDIHGSEEDEGAVPPMPPIFRQDPRILHGYEEQTGTRRQSHTFENNKITNTCVHNLTYIIFEALERELHNVHDPKKSILGFDEIKPCVREKKVIIYDYPSDDLLGSQGSILGHDDKPGCRGKQPVIMYEEIYKRPVASDKRGPLGSQGPLGYGGSGPGKPVVICEFPRGGSGKLGPLGTQDLSRITIHSFGTALTERLVKNMVDRGNLTLKNSKFYFAAESLKGKVLLEEGYSYLETDLKVVGVSKSLISNVLKATYTYKVPKISIQYWFVFLSATNGTMTGVVEIQLIDQEMEAIITARKASDGTCSYESRLDVTMDLKRYNATFLTEHNFPSTSMTQRGEKVINTFIIQNLLQNKHREMFSKLGQTLGKSVKEAADIILNESGGSLCQA